MLQYQTFILLPRMVRLQRASYKLGSCDGDNLHRHTTLACISLCASRYTCLQEPLSLELGLKSQEMAKGPFQFQPPAMNAFFFFA